MSQTSRTDTLRKMIQHPVVRMTAAALLQAVATHLAQKGAAGSSRPEACAPPRQQDTLPENPTG
ncbi:hypothetical protein RKD37_001335 [Streptomyces ambofaciens]